MVGLRLSFGYLISVAFGFIVSRLRAAEILQPGLIHDLPLRRSGFRVAAAPTAPNAGERDFAEIAKEAGFAPQNPHGRAIGHRRFPRCRVLLHHRHRHRERLQYRRSRRASSRPSRRTRSSPSSRSWSSPRSWRSAPPPMPSSPRASPAFPYEARLAFLVFGADVRREALLALRPPLQAPLRRATSRSASSSPWPSSAGASATSSPPRHPPQRPE